MAGTVALVLGYGATVVEHFCARAGASRRRLIAVLLPFGGPRGSCATRRRAALTDRPAAGGTVLFSDIRGFTFAVREAAGRSRLAEMLREYPDGR